MFVDEARIIICAGTGGNGASTFRREKYVPRGGPDGGDGGVGGSIYLVADSGLTTLLDFRYKSRYNAPHGDHGRKSNKHGKDAENLSLRVPVGTLVKDSASGEIIGDMAENGHRLLVAAGGRGGRGNARFPTATNQAPRYCENGEPGQAKELLLELKLLADVGLVGLPNAGKSSLLNRVSAAHPKIADYPFTTIVPILGVVSLGDDRSCVMADIPGLIEGAHEGHGLGHQFLRHIERTRILIHVVDITGGDSGDALQNFTVVRSELTLHNARLATLPVLVALNKTDLSNAEEIKTIKNALELMGLEVFPISAATGAGIDLLLYRIAQILPLRPQPVAGLEASTAVPVVIGPPRNTRLSREWAVKKDPDGVWRVSGEGLERVVAMTNVNNTSALERLDRVLERNGIIEALKKAGIQEDETVRIRDTEFKFVEAETQYGPRRQRDK